MSNETSKEISKDAYNKAGWVTLLSATFLSFASLAYFMFLHEPVELNEESQISSALLEEVNEILDISKEKEYWVSSELMVKKGAKLYSQYCSICHGNTGRGDGIAGKNLKPPARDFTKGEWKFGGTSKSIFTVVTKGSAGTSMASFSHIPKLERWALVHFVRSLTNNKVKDNLEQLKSFAESAN